MMGGGIGTKFSLGLALVTSLVTTSYVMDVFFFFFCLVWVNDPDLLILKPMSTSDHTLEMLATLTVEPHAKHHRVVLWHYAFPCIGSPFKV